jgi:hypothetical protein
MPDDLSYKNLQNLNPLVSALSDTDIAWVVTDPDATPEDWKATIAQIRTAILTGLATEASAVTLGVRNSSGVQIDKGTPVYESGWNSGTGLIEVEPADADDAALMPAIGIVDADIANNSSGQIIVQGILETVDTSFGSDGDPIYVDTTAGALTNVRPVDRLEAVQKVGTILRAHATTGAMLITGANRSNDNKNTNYDPDRVPVASLLQTGSDEFDGNGPTWTARNQGTYTITVTNNLSQQTRHYALGNTDNLWKVLGFSTPVVGAVDFAVTAKTSFECSGTNYSSTFLALLEGSDPASPDNIWAFAHNVLDEVKVQQYTSYADGSPTTKGTTVDTTNFGDPSDAYMTVYRQIRYDYSTKTATFYMSLDGVSWQLCHTEVLTNHPENILLGANDGASGTANIYHSWVRVRIDADGLAGACGS